VKGDLGFLRAMLKEIRRQASSHVKEEGKGRDCAGPVKVRQVPEENCNI